MPPEIIPYTAAHHPARYRHRVGLVALFFGLFASPIVWAGNLMVTYALGIHACFPGRQPLSGPVQAIGFVAPLILACYLIALCICVASFAVALRNWRITGSESEGHMDDLVEVGEGRTRFLGIIGMAFSVLFFAAVLFGLISLWIVPVCAR